MRTDRGLKSALGMAITLSQSINYTLLRSYIDISSEEETAVEVKLLERVLVI